MVASSKTCNVCGKAGHLARTCPSKGKSCDICGKVGHLAVKCRQADRGGGKKVKDVAGIVCNNCGAVGHIAGQCPEPCAARKFGAIPRNSL